MSNFSVEILEPQISILEITTSTVDTFGVNSTSSTFGIDIEQNINGEVSSVHNSIDVTATIGDDTTNIVEIERYNDCDFPYVDHFHAACVCVCLKVLDVSGAEEVGPGGHRGEGC